MLDRKVKENKKDEVQTQRRVRGSDWHQHVPHVCCIMGEMDEPQMQQRDMDIWMAGLKSLHCVSAQGSHRNIPHLS